MSEFGRVGPVNDVAEQSLLGALLANNRVYERIYDVLRPEFFATEIYREIYAAAVQMIEAGRVADAISMDAYFGPRSVTFLGGQEKPLREVLSLLLSCMCSPLTSREYALAIAEAWHRRQLIDIGQTSAQQAHSNAGADGEHLSARDVHEAMEARLFQIGEQLTDAGDIIEASDSIARAIASAEAASKRPSGLVGIPSGLRALDYHTGGWRPGQLTVLGARPSMGKTAVALAIACGAAYAQHPVLFASLEMSSEQIGARLVAGLSGLPGDSVDRGMRRDRDALGRFIYQPLEQADWNDMVSVQRRLADSKAFPLVIDECRQRTMSAIRTRARQLKRKRGLALIVIDYLGLMRVPELIRSDNRNLEVSRISADAKAMAKELNVPVLLLSQLNRAVEGREDRRPRLSDLRDSGSLEQDADIVMFLHREHYYLVREPIKRRGNETDEKLFQRTSDYLTAVEKNKGRAQLFIDKFRMGRVGTVDLAFNDSNGWISDLPDDGGEV
jgi:replicative DNA helicase